MCWGLGSRGSPTGVHWGPHIHPLLDEDGGVGAGGEKEWELVLWGEQTTGGPSQGREPVGLHTSGEMRGQ